MSERPVIRLKAERAPQHPLVYSNSVEKPEQRLPPGSIVDIVDRVGTWCGRGFYNGHARVALRILTRDRGEPVDEGFFERRLQHAITLRHDVLKLERSADAYRVVNSEGDGLSGLVVDRLGNTIVYEYFSAGMWRQRELIYRTFDKTFPDSQHYWFAETHVAKQESFDCRTPDAPTPSIIQEHGLRFHVAPGSAHKTGFFVDQRDNRLLLSELCADRDVLDLCCNSGGFAIYASARGKARSVTALDIDAGVLELAQSNAELNDASVGFIASDMFAWFTQAHAQGLRYDVVVLDPPKLTRNAEQIIPALKKYQEINRLALGLVRPGGVFLTCSCTGLISEVQFLETLRRAAFFANRNVQVLKVSGAGPDHPFSVNVPEGRYLKAVWCRVT